jgi:hypothetical protein
MEPRRPEVERGIRIRGGDGDDGRGEKEKCGGAEEEQGRIGNGKVKVK